MSQCDCDFITVGGCYFDSKSISDAAVHTADELLAKREQNPGSFLETPEVHNLIIQGFSTSWKMICYPAAFLIADNDVQP